ncbi:glucuronate isomerase [Croceivirga thetidis]|uniref:Uronate isomerase n=1 Tax=Croceivirga thetidis TaxID=2721623 RepID=A0ABX1GKP0_9FLAO|nr:glucuronate isomerase [Croceivirga thetidis]NKI30448.1 glucuronate isomerase [Croceivirga thetidis]
MAKAFLDDNFLLQSKTAEKLFHDFARDLPIIDYHNHLNPEHIATNKSYANITEIWLKEDHYKWRAMRANGIDEKYITGKATAKDKFQQWAETVPYTMRNPLYHWTHLELQRYFNISDLLNPTSAIQIYEETNQQLQKADFNSQGLLDKMKVEVICTTDDPTDRLEFHETHRSGTSKLKMLPTFRPDKLITIDNPDFLSQLAKLEAVVGTEIKSFTDLVSALEKRIDFFDAKGCQLADHGMAQLFAISPSEKKLDGILGKKRDGKTLTQEEAALFQMTCLHELAQIYNRKNWTMQFHLGALRNNSDRLMRLVGADAGTDSIGDFEQATGLAAFLNRLDKIDSLPKTILYNLNPKDNEVFATMAGNFNDGSMAAKIQWGSAWWFLDQKDGMEKQINTLSNMGLLSRFIGMLTDSRSLLSFPRHEYFRRILCNLLGQDIENGELPNDINWIGQLVEDICYNNAKSYFGF